MANGQVTPVVSRSFEHFQLLRLNTAISGVGLVGKISNSAGSGDQGGHKTGPRVSSSGWDIHIQPITFRSGEMRRSLIMLAPKAVLYRYGYVNEKLG
ncbi:hypothetical protein TNCV_42871 [Trichonephila clavipes]|nr:hypothetical protein TNCV_42871 [Trichonephila clavipes]